MPAFPMPALGLPPLPRAVALAAGIAAMALSGCGQEAGSAIRSAEFGSATMNNHLAQTCEAGPQAAPGKYDAQSGACAGRTLDGRYAQVIYDNYVAGAAQVPEVTGQLWQ